MRELPCEFGNYTLLAELGRGGMGVVYRAEQKSLGRPVALKILRVAGEWADEEVLARFRREGEVMARLSHPDIVAIHDFGIHDDRPFIVMDLVSGLPMDRHLETHFPSVESSLAIVARVARALHHAHAQGIIHRDIKPSNILIDASGSPRLTDFGLAKVEGARLTRSEGALLGTPVYMSPEQAEGRAADVRSDVYSIGAVLYEAITGGPPFTGASLESILHKVLSTDPVPPRVVNPKIPRDAETLCLTAMARDPARRYASALEFAEDIERFLRGEPIAARPPGILETAIRRMRRHRGATLAVVASFVILLIAAFVVHQLLSRLRRQETAAREREELDARFRCAEERFEGRHYPEALEIYDRLIGSAVDSPALRLRRAICLRESGRAREAEGEFSRLVESAPRDAALWRHRALNSLALDNVAGAIRSYREAARLLGIAGTRAAEERSDFDAVAILVERHFGPLDPHSSRCFLALIDPHYVRPLPTKPEAVSLNEPTKNLTESDWRSVFPVRDIGASGAQYLTPWFERHGEHPVLVFWRGLKAQSRPEEALADLDRVVAELPLARWAYYFRGVIRRKIGRSEEARRDWEAMKTLAPYDRILRLGVAWALTEARDPAAIAEFDSLVADLEAGRVEGIPAAYCFWGAQAAVAAGKPADVARLLRKSGMKRSAVEGAWLDPVRDDPEVRRALEELPR